MTESVGGGVYRRVQLLDGEEVVDQQLARYSERLVRARRKLFLTNGRLIFCPVKSWIGPSVPIAVDFEEITAIGRRRGGWMARLFILGQNADSWFLEAGGRRYWFDMGLGWNKMWMEKFAGRLGLTPADVKNQ